MLLQSQHCAGTAELECDAVSVRLGLVGPRIKCLRAKTDQQSCVSPGKLPAALFFPLLRLPQQSAHITGAAAASSSLTATVSLAAACAALLSGQQLRNAKLGHWLPRLELARLLPVVQRGLGMLSGCEGIRADTALQKSQEL